MFNLDVFGTLSHSESLFLKQCKDYIPINKIKMHDIEQKVFEMIDL